MMEFNLDNVTAESINNFLNNNQSEVIIININQNEYIQIIKLESKFSVEAKELNTLNLLRHYRIGKLPNINIWNFINTNHGLVTLKSSELLTKVETLEIINSYINKRKIDSIYYKRNITKEVS